MNEMEIETIYQSDQNKYSSNRMEFGAFTCLGGRYTSFYILLDELPYIHFSQATPDSS